MSSRTVKSFYEASRYLGQYIGQNNDFLKKTACMGIERRKQIAILEWYLELPDLGDLDNLSEKEALKQIVIPLFEKLGYAEWLRDTVTDMAIKLGLSSDTENFGEKSNAEENTEESPNDS